MKNLRHLFSFKGRAGRTEYFLHTVGDFVVLILFMIAFAKVDNHTRASEVLDAINTVLLVVIIIGGMVAEICVTVRRFHDLDRSGSSFFGTWVPIYNLYLGCILLFKRGNPLPNSYGPARREQKRLA